MGLYVYCLSEELSEAWLAGVRGLHGEPARLFESEGLKVVVSPFDEAPAPVTREHVMAHNRVNAQVLAATTPLPFRFGTLTDELRLAAYVRERAVDLRAALARVRGCVEMSVKLMWETPSEAPAAEPEPAAGGEAAGTAFLLAKRRALLGEEDARRRAEELAAWLARSTSDLARESEASVRPTDSLVVRAAHLVGREHVAAYRERLRGLRAERPDLRFLTSGPWPPYSFAEVGATRPPRG